MASKDKDPKPTLNIFSRTDATEPPQPAHPPAEVDISDLDEGTVRPVGIGLTEGERTALDELANKNGVTRHSLLKLAVRFFIQDVRAGRHKLDDYFDDPPPPKKVLKKRRK